MIAITIITLILLVICASAYEGIKRCENAYEKEMHILKQELEAMKQIPLDEVSYWNQWKDEDGEGYSVCGECNYMYNNKAFFEIYTSKFCPHCGRYMVNWSDHEKGKVIE